MDAEDKIKVFISSMCGDKYEVVRKALECLIKETGLAKAYVFETAAASSQNVRSSYLNKVDNCDLFVLLVDNADGISQAVLSEIKQAESANKKMLCFFCNETGANETDYQKELVKTGKCKFEVVNKFSDLVQRAYISIVQDIIDSYIAPRVVTPVQVSELDDTAKQKIAFIGEDIFKELTSSKKELSRHIFNNTRSNESTSSELDKSVRSFLQVLLCEQKFDDDAFRQLKSLIVKLFSGHMQKVIEFRLDAVRFFFMADLNSCIDSLEKAVEFITNSKSIPTWVLNDVAIDLRNMITEKGLKQNRFIIDNKGQNIINSTKELVVFPLIDRISTNISKQAIKHYNNVLLESPYTVSFGGIEEILEDVGDYYCRSLMFGSITHLRMVLSKYNEVLLPLCLEYNEKSFMFELIKNYVLLGDSKALEKYLRTNNMPSIVFSSFNLDGLYANTENLPLENERVQAKVLLAKHFGYYLSDKCFASFSQWLFDVAKDSIKKSRIGEIFGLIVEAIKGVIHRLNQNDIMDFIVECLSSKDSIVLLKAFNLLNSIQYKQLDNQHQIDCKNALINLYNDNISEKLYLNNATIRFCLNCSITYDDLEKVIKEKDTDFYNGNYKLELIDRTQEDLMDQVKRFVSTIDYRNKTQGRNSFIGFAGDPYGTIGNIVNSVSDELTYSDIKDVVSVCIDTLYAPRQGAKDKISAIELISNLRSKYPCFAEWNETIKTICAQKEKIYECYYDGIFDKTSRRMVIIAVELLMLSFNQNNDFVACISEISTLDEYDIIGCLQLISDYLKNVVIEDLSDTIVLSILQACIGLSRHKERDIKLFAVQILTQLTSSKFKENALKQLSALFDIGTQEMKIAIISRINKIDFDSEIVDYIKRKAKVDANYLVRDLALNP